MKLSKKKKAALAWLTTMSVVGLFMAPIMVIIVWLLIITALATCELVDAE